MKWNEIPGISKDKNGNVRAYDPGSLTREPKPGDVYEYVVLITNPTGRIYQPGTKLKLIEQTSHAPWGIMSSRGYNWLVEVTPNDLCWWHCMLGMNSEKCEKGAKSISVYSSIEQSIKSGYVKLISEESNEKAS